METFAFKAATQFGKVIEGSREAASRAALIEDLRQGGLIPIRIAPQAEQVWTWRKSAQQFSQTDLALILRELAALLAAGVAAERAIAIAVRTVSRPRLKSALGRLHELVRGGTPFAAAAREALPGLPPNALSLLEAGDASASLGDSVAQAARALEDALAFRQSLTGALIYPSILFATSIGAVIFLLTFVVPQFKSAFDEAGAHLPLATLILMGIGDACSKFGPYVLIALVAGVAMLLRWRATPRGRQAIDAFILRAPVIGDLVLRLEMARFARTVGSLLQARVPLVRALKLAEAGAGNTGVTSALKQAAERTKQGERLASSLAAHAPWPAEAIEIVAIGEESGRLDLMLNHLADLYESDIKRRSERLLTILTPVLTLTMAGFVAAIITAILSAILGAYDLPL